MLVVEDHVPMREAIRVCIESSFPGLSVIEASNGATALKCVEAHCPSLVLVDVNLPDADGVDLMRLILKQWPCTFVACISIDTSADLAERARAAGAVEFIGKDKLFKTLLPLVGAVFTLTNWMKGLECHSLVTEDSPQNLASHAEHLLETGVRPVGQE